MGGWIRSHGWLSGWWRIREGHGTIRKKRAAVQCQEYLGKIPRGRITPACTFFWTKKKRGSYPIRNASDHHGPLLYSGKGQVFLTHYSAPVACTASHVPGTNSPFCFPPSLLIVSFHWQKKLYHLTSIPLLLNYCCCCCWRHWSFFFRIRFPRAITTTETKRIPFSHADFLKSATESSGNDESSIQKSYSAPRDIYTNWAAQSNQFCEKEEEDEDKGGWHDEVTAKKIGLRHISRSLFEGITTRPVLLPLPYRHRNELTVLASLISCWSHFYLAAFPWPCRQVISSWRALLCITLNNRPISHRDQWGPEISPIHMGSPVPG